MTTYNGSKYIKSQINSILKQDYPNIELIIVDDFSTDNTYNILEKFKKFDNIQVYRNEKNLGLIRNFEKSISHCNGDFIALADQDDIWKRNKLSILYQNIKSYSLICSNATLINEKNQIISMVLNDFTKSEFDFSPSQILFNNYITGCTLLFNANLKKILLIILTW